ncbi:MAG: asparaginase, partial [Chloroflexi bacterium]|nr:asparaginase [Chloroflexota bacterium]
MSISTGNASPTLPPLVEVRRGPLVESLYRGVLVVSDAHGRVLAAAGDPDYVTYMRSSAKPLQAVAMVESGAADRFGFADEELAVMTGSHSGSPAHVRAVCRALQRLGLDASALVC